MHYRSWWRPANPDTFHFSTSLTDTTYVFTLDMILEHRSTVIIAVEAVLQHHL